MSDAKGRRGFNIQLAWHDWVVSGKCHCSRCSQSVIARNDAFFWDSKLIINVTSMINILSIAHNVDLLSSMKIELLHQFKHLPIKGYFSFTLIVFDWVAAWTGSSEEVWDVFHTFKLFEFLSFKVDLLYLLNFGGIKKDGEVRIILEFWWNWRMWAWCTGIWLTCVFRASLNNNLIIDLRLMVQAWLHQRALVSPRWLFDKRCLHAIRHEFIGEWCLHFKRICLLMSRPIISRWLLLLVHALPHRWLKVLLLRDLVLVVLNLL